MKVRVILGDKNGKEGIEYATNGDRVYSYHPSHKGEEVIFTPTSKGLVFLYGDDGVDYIMELAGKHTGHVDVVKVKHKTYEKLLPIIMVAESYQPGKTTLTLKG